MNPLLRRVLLGATFVATWPLPAAADSNWWNASWSTRRKLTFNNSAQATNLVNFPVLVRLDSGRTDYARVQDAGQDIRFVDANNLSLLPHEIEKWDESGSSYVWVKVPQIDAGSATDFIYMYFGNPTAADGQSAAAVWDTDFKMVHHLEETSGQHQDSTTNNNDSVVVSVTAQGTAAGRVNGADTFAGTNNVDVADAASLDAAAGELLTVEAWVRSSSSSNLMVAVSKEEDFVAEYQLWVQNGNGSFWVNYDPDGTDPLEYSARVNSAVNVRNGNWHYLVGRWNGVSKTADMFIDGAAAGTPATEVLIDSLATANPLVIGEEGDANRGGNFDGDLDEVRVSKILRSPDWIRAQNLSMTDAFITFGGEPAHRFTDVTAHCGLAGTRSPLDKASQRKVVRDNDGNWYLVFGRFRETGGAGSCSGYQEIRLARSTDGGATWTEVVLFGSGGLAYDAANGFTYASIDANPAGDQLHVVVQDMNGQQVLYTKNVSLASWDQASTWTHADGTRGGANQGAERLDGSGFSGNSTTAPVVAVDAGNRAHVAFEADAGGGATGVYWRYYQPSNTAWYAPAEITASTPTTTNGRDVSIDFGEGKNQSGTVERRVHFLYMDDGDADGDYERLRYAWAKEDTGPDTYTTVTRLPTTGPGAYVYILAPGAFRTMVSASVAAWNGEVYLVGGLDPGSFPRIRFAYSSTNGDTWTVGNNGGASSPSQAMPSGSEGYPVVGVDRGGLKHRIMAAEAVGGTTTRLYGYQWRHRRYFANEDSDFRFRSLLYLDNDAGETTDYSHFTMEKHRRGADFAYCWYVSTNNALPPPPLLVDEIRCNTEPAVMYRSISFGSKASYSAGTVTATNGSRSVTGAGGTTWQTGLWGVGDRISIAGTDYAVSGVTSNTQLTLATPYLGTTGGGKTYALSRQFNTIPNWESCVSGNAVQCPGLGVSSGSLVSDNRIEVGVVYKDGGNETVATTIDGSTTDIAHPITLTVAPASRHKGINVSGAYIQNMLGAATIAIKDLNVTVEWLGFVPSCSEGAIQVDVTDGGFNGPIDIHHNLIINATSCTGINVGPTEAQNVVVDIHDNIVEVGATITGIRLNPVGNTFNPGSDLYIVNNTVAGTSANGILSIPASNLAVSLVNNIVHGFTTCFSVPTPTGTADYNLSTDGTALGGNSRINVPASQVAGVNFVDPPGNDYHLATGFVAINAGATLGNTILRDIDSQPRPAGPAWDIGADEYNGTTAVTLMSFETLPSDGAVDLLWRTGSEIDNLGFRIYRSLSANGPWTRLTSSLIPGQGFSAMGAAYAWRDSGLANGTRYYYRLEDVDSKSVSSFHGPVSAVPQAGVTPAPPSEGPGSGGAGSGGSGSSATSSSCPAWALAQLGSSSSSYTCSTHGDPSASSFRILSRSASSALVELQTPGFLTARDPSGRVRALVRGFDSLSDPTAPALPLRRSLLDGVVGRKARIRSIEARENRFFPGLVAAAVGYPQAVVSSDGTVRPGRRDAELALSRGFFPRVQARLAGEGFQGEGKTLSLELMPLRYDASRGALVLSQRLTVRVDFAGAEPSEIGRGRLGRRIPRSRPDSSAYAFLATSRKGLHSVSFEALFPGRTRPLDLSLLRLSDAAPRVDRASVPFHVIPEGPSFGPGSRLFFLADSVASSTSFTSEVVYALERGTGGVRMSSLPAPTDGSAPVPSRALGEWESNRYFIADVLDVQDLWQWEPMLGGVSKTKPFSLDGLDPSSPLPLRLRVFLQGASDSSSSPADHHVQLFVRSHAAASETLVAETSFDGAVPQTLEVDLSPSLLQDGLNDLRVLNVGDTGVSSKVFLDRFELLYPQTTAARSGLFEGRFASAGTAEVTGLSSPAALLDATAGAWLTGFEAGPSLRFHAEADHRYLAVSEEALLSPRVFFPEPSARLRSAANQADYLLIAPQAFMAAAQPLLDRRASQGLSTFAASLEEITSSFGSGQPSGEAIRDFLAFAYHHWTRPSPRYVLLLGDSNYDPRHFSSFSQPSPLPYLLQRNSYIWTASDPALAALNGDDILPDLAIGRLPATTVEQAQTMVAKILDWEDQGFTLDGKVALVADNPDLAGDFEADVRDIECSFLQGRDTTQGLPRRARVPRRREEPHPRRFQPGTRPHLLRRPRRRRRLGLREHAQLPGPQVPPRPVSTAPHAHHELPQRLLHRPHLRVPRRGFPQGPRQGHHRLLLPLRPLSRRPRPPLPPSRHRRDHRRPAPEARRRTPRRSEGLRTNRRHARAPLPLPPLR